MAGAWKQAINENTKRYSPGCTELEREERTNASEITLPSISIPASDSGWECRMLTIHKLTEADVTQTVNANTVDFRRDTITQAIIF